MATFVKFRSLRRILAVLIVAFSLSSPATGSTPTLLPSGALGFVHIEVKQLLDTPTLRIPAALLKEVTDELSELSFNQSGLDLTDVEDVTLIVPELPTLQKNLAADYRPYVVAVTLRSRFNPDNITEHRPSTWGTATAGGAIYHSNGRGAAIAPVTNRTVLFGSDASIRWCLKSKNAASRARRHFPDSASRGQISAFVDLQSLPPEYLKSVPIPAQELAKMESVSVLVDISRGTTVDLGINFGGPSEAALASRQIRRLMDLSKSRLGGHARELEGQLATPDSDPMQLAATLVDLAITRHAQSHLAMATIRQNSETVSLLFRSQHDLGHATFLFGTIGAGQKILTNKSFLDSLRIPSE